MKLVPILAGSVALATAAQGADNSDIVVQNGPTARVSYADLNLNSQAGRERLAGRIESAASVLCLDTNVEPVSVRMDRARCYRAAVASGADRMSRIVLLP
jgi:UrcA family protein